MLKGMEVGGGRGGSAKFVLTRVVESTDSNTKRTYLLLFVICLPMEHSIRCLKRVHAFQIDLESGSVGF